MRGNVKVVEVLDVQCLDREPREGAPNNRWIAVVVVEIRAPVHQHSPRFARRTVTVIARDALAAYTKLLTEGTSNHKGANQWNLQDD
jgi:hypothetical protein